MKRRDFVLVTSCVFFKDMFYCLVSFAVNVLVSIFSWVLLCPSEVAFGQPCKRLGHQNHDGPYRQSHHCSNRYCSFRRFSGGNWVSGLGHIGTYWDILGHMAHILGLLERPR